MRKVTLLLQLLKERDERIQELEDRLQAKSLAELRAFRPVAMPAPEDEPDGYWVSDSTGLTREFIRADRADG